MKRFIFFSPPLLYSTNSGIQIRLCFPRLCAWLADHVENCYIHGISTNRCPTCLTSPEALGNFMEEFIPHPYQKYQEVYQNYRTNPQENKSSTQTLKADGIQLINNALWYIPYLLPSDLIRADLLHTIYLGLLKHMMIWIQGFLSDLGRLHIFDQIWCSLPPYPGFTPPNRAYRLISQRIGKEFRNLARVILAVFVAALKRQSDTRRLTQSERNNSQEAIRCVRYLTDYSLMTLYPNQSETNIHLMTEYLKDFHNSKHIFLRYQAGKNTKRSILDLSRQLVSEDSEVFSKDFYDELIEENADYNFPKMHLVVHYPDQIRRFGSLPQYSTDV